MLQTNQVLGTHIECVDGDHNKYYRTFLITSNSTLAKPTFLIRNWGRRGAPRGQWMRDARIGTGAQLSSRDIFDEKVYEKGYVEIHSNEFSIDDATLTALRASSPKSVDGDAAGALGAAFEAQWCLDVVEDTIGFDDDAVEALAWIPAWAGTRAARAPARQIAANLETGILHVDTQTDLAVVRAPLHTLRGACNVFDGAQIVAASDDDDAEFAMVATRLWAPTSTGPYRSLQRATRDARRLFRRTPAAVAQ
jgi:hypothetical protein